MAVVNVTDLDFEEKVTKSSLPVFVDFFAPWCGPCKMAEPVIEELAKDYEGKAVIAKINVDENQENGQKYNVSSIPTIIFFKDGKEVDRTMGVQSKNELVKKLEELA